MVISLTFLFYMYSFSIRVSFFSSFNIRISTENSLSTFWIINDPTMLQFMRDIHFIDHDAVANERMIVESVK